MASYEQLYGKARLPEAVAGGSHLDIHGRHLPAAGALVLHDRDGNILSAPALAAHYGAADAVADAGATPAIRSYAEWYGTDVDGVYKTDPGQPLGASSTVARTAGIGRALPRRSVVTAAHFKQLASAGGRRRETDLWALVEDLLLDAERAPRYDPSVIGIASTPPQRRWFLSQYAHLQDVLMRRPLLRRATVVCGWLERTYREMTRQPRLRGDEEVVLRQLLLTYLRGGELYKAIDAAIACGDGGYSCVLSAAQLQTVKEPWFLQTAVVPLFGEYAHGELDQAWCGNEHRLDNLAQLYEDSQSYARPESSPRHGFDAVIAAALCGNLEVLEPAFAVNNNWRDVAWCYLRCALTTVFSKVLMDAGGAQAEGGAYRAYLERQTGGSDDWLPRFERQLLRGLTQRLAGGFLGKAPLEEQLMMRVVLQLLTPTDCDGGYAAGAAAPCWLNVDLPAPTSPALEWGMDVREHREAVRLLVHVLLVLDAAYGETLSEYAVQVECGDTLAAAMRSYATALALLPNYRFDAGMVSVIALARRLRDQRSRAGVYAAFLSAARVYELERQTLSRERLEEQEAQLVRLFVEADADPAVHAEVQRLLNGQVPADALLTHNPLAERLLWEAMHAATTQDYLATLRRGLEACVEFWLSTHPPTELDAIADVSRTLARRVLPFLPAQDAAVSRMEASEATFWYLFSEARDVAREHTKIAGQLAAARATTSTDRTLLFQLAQDEAATMRRLMETTQRAVRHGGAVIVNRSRDCVTAILWLAQQLTEDVTLSLMGAFPASLATGEGADRGRSGEGGDGVALDELGRMQSVFALVDELGEAGYLEPALLPQACAAELYSRIRAMRVAYGQRVHRRQVQAALQQAQAGAAATVGDRAVLASSAG